jgi:hypothetical protein
MWVRNALHFDAVNGKNQVTMERLYSEKRNRGRAPAIIKEVVGELKPIKKQKGEREKSKQSQFPSLAPRAMGVGSKKSNDKIRYMALMTDWQFQLQDKSTQTTSLIPSKGFVIL